MSELTLSRAGRVREAKVLHDRQEPNVRGPAGSGRHAAVSRPGVSRPNLQVSRSRRDSASPPPSLSLFRTRVELETKINRSGREIDQPQHGHGHRYHSPVPRSRIPRARVQVNPALLFFFLPSIVPARGSCPLCKLRRVLFIEENLSSRRTGGRHQAQVPHHGEFAHPHHLHGVTRPTFHFTLPSPGVPRPSLQVRGNV